MKEVAFTIQHIRDLFSSKTQRNKSSDHYGISEKKKLSFLEIIFWKYDHTLMTLMQEVSVRCFDDIFFRF